MHISEGMKLELKWWVDNLAEQKRVIDHGNPDMIVTTDASNSGLGAICKDSRIGGRWNESESTNHINYLELLAVSHGLKSFCKFSKNLHVQIKSDNTYCISNISNMGSIKSEKCNILARSIWLWCIERNIWLSATFVPGFLNEADFESRNFSESVEWKLSKSIFSKISQIWGVPDIDMFASRIISK